MQNPYDPPHAKCEPPPTVAQQELSGGQAILFRFGAIAIGTCIALVAFATLVIAVEFLFRVVPPS